MGKKRKKNGNVLLRKVSSIEDGAEKRIEHVSSFVDFHTCKEKVVKADGATTIRNRCR